jgi:hypothetical protein
VNLPTSSQQVLFAQAPPTTVRSLGTRIRVPAKLVKFHIALSTAISDNHLVCTWGDLLWATASVGRPGLAQMIQHGEFSWYEMAYRLCMVEANLKLSATAEIMKTSAFTALDPSEKNAISYFLGLSFVKLFSELALDVPWLLHVDRYRAALGVTTSTLTNMRPDLLGLDVRGDWLAFEAKGRSGAFSTIPIAKGKYQLAQLLEVQGRSPKMRLVAQTYFKSDKLAFYCEDPDADLVGYGINIPDDAYFSQYYGPVIEMLDRLSGSAPFADFTDIGLSIGLDPDIHRMVRSRDWQGVKRWAAESKHQSTEDRVVGRDGIIVRYLRGPSHSGILTSETPKPDENPQSVRSRHSVGVIYPAGAR